MTQEQAVPHGEIDKCNAYHRVSAHTAAAIHTYMHAHIHLLLSLHSRAGPTEKGMLHLEPLGALPDACTAVDTASPTALQAYTYRSIIHESP